ncbi:hypothetical protein [Nodosilinea sp. P-1105]|uniref:hypothetical protein n=1 Tax=Nodosilinea sp. P-1105 TaxID=2546229 RepID=UPI00146A2867|nr:hypothetical protein [Nodosilinea sp. P-1105]NMF82648.1 hypothetical protein [Nodosilinea sp. P-1105]
MEELLDLKDRLRQGDIAGALMIVEDEDLRGALEEAYEPALNAASLDVAEGIYEPEALASLVDRDDIIQQALAQVIP